MKGIAILPASERELNWNTGQRDGIYLRTLQERSHLIILDSEIKTSILLRNLRKVSAYQRLSDIHVMLRLILV